MSFRFQFRIGIQAMALSIAACVTPQERELPLPPEPLVHKGFALNPPSEPGWLEIHRGRPYKLDLQKRGSTTDETHAIHVWLMELPGFKDDEEFIAFIKQEMADTGSRFKTLEEKENIIEVASGKCVQAYDKSEDLSPRRASNSQEAMILESISFVCRHPIYYDLGVLVAYSHRYDPGNSDPGLEGKARSVFDKIQFTDEFCLPIEEGGSLEKVEEALSNYALDLRKENREGEAIDIEGKARLFHKANISKEINYYLGFDPSDVLQEYAQFLHEGGRDDKKNEIEVLANWHSRGNLKAAERALKRSHGERDRCAF